MWKFIIGTFLIWKIGLLIIAWLASLFVPQRSGFLGPSVWANFDGVHYLSIAQNGYMRYQEVFFPLYPLVIRFLAKTFFFGNFLWAGLFISHFSLFTALVIFYKLIKDEFDEKKAKLSIVGFLVFPTSFFFAAVYTESLFLMLILASFYMAKKENWFWAGIFGGLTSATRLVGIFLLPALLWTWWEKNKVKSPSANWQTKGKPSISADRTLNENSRVVKRYSFLWLLLIPAGLITYLWYMNGFVGDSLAFVHSQPAFGAQRTGGAIILLPQVYWRYLKIFLTVSFANYDFWIAVLEFLIFNLTLLSLYWVIRKKINTSYMIFSVLAIITPPMTGTFSSIPRYTLVLFPIFFLYGAIGHRKTVVLIYVLSFALLGFLTVLFTRGFFVA